VAWIFLAAFVTCFGVSAVWSAATPLLAAPDEPAQIVKAAAVVHGQWTGCFLYDAKLGHCVPDPSNPDASEKLPAFFAMVLAPDGADLSCFIHKSTVPASCERSLNRSPSAYDVKLAYDEYAHTYVARYPPLYYLLVGLPSRFGGSTIDLYLMRLISAALSSIFLALAFTGAFVWSRSRLLPIAVGVSLTPMVLFLAAVVNPSGLEISSAIACWTAGVILVTERLDAPPVGLLLAFVISGATLALSRGLSPFWLGCVVVLLLLTLKRRQLWHAFGQRQLRLVALGVVVAAIGALAWILPEHALLQYVGAHSNVTKGVGTLRILATAFRHNAYYLPDMVGVFGWFDTYSPLLTFAIWGVLALGLLAAVYRFGTRRTILVMTMLIIGVLLIPVVIVASHARQYGYNWSGRDTLPLAVGLPILAVSLLARDWSFERVNQLTRRARIYVVPAIGLAQFLAFYEALRRYAVGTHGALFAFIAHPSWHPAVGIVGALLLDLLALVCYCALLWKLSDGRSISNAPSPLNSAEKVTASTE
jgi:Predicted membrane protein (DUF2142)